MPATTGHQREHALGCQVPKWSRQGLGPWFVGVDLVGAVREAGAATLFLTGTLFLMIVLSGLAFAYLLMKLKEAQGES